MFVQQSKAVQVPKGHKLHSENNRLPTCHTLPHSLSAEVGAAAQARQPALTSCACSRTYSEVQLLPDINGVAGFLIRLGEGLTGCSDSMKCDL